MNEKKAQELINIAPEFFNENFYFECRDGWFDILETLIGRIKWGKDNWSGWDEALEEFEIVQIKEKFGTLRFYTGAIKNVDGASVYDRVRGMIGVIEQLSAKICEVCGAKGKARPLGWRQTLCDEHFEEAVLTKLYKDCSGSKRSFEDEEVVCFSCLKVFHSEDIKEWADKKRGRDYSPICPHCHVDSVVMTDHEFEVDTELVKKMKERYFWRRHRFQHE